MVDSFAFCEEKCGIEQNGGIRVVRYTYQASPKFMAPMHNGLTLTAAVGDSRRCLARRDFGGGAGSMMFWRKFFDELYVYRGDCVVKILRFLSSIYIERG